MRNATLGRHVFGLAVVAFGLVTLAWPGYYGWLGLQITSAEIGRLIAYCAAAAQIVGGVAMQFRRSAKAGAAIGGAVYLVVALLSVRHIVATPQSYDPWGNFFEQFSLATGAALVFGQSTAMAPSTLRRLGRLLFGVCAASFGIEQAVHLSPTASLVPSWLPPGQLFWAVATTVAFALAAVALWTTFMALLASRLLTLMLMIFGLGVWIPLLLSSPTSHVNLSETAETIAIAGSAWILADLLNVRTAATARASIKQNR